MTREKLKIEYLKIYLEDGRKRKPKKKSRNPQMHKIKIFDENVDVKDIKFGEEEAPMVVDWIDERADKVKIKEVYKASKLKRLHSSAKAGSRPTEMYGLLNAASLRKVTKDMREREKEINQLNEELSGRNAATIVRDRSGRKRNLDGEYHEKLEKEKKKELQQKYAQWGKGIEQSESQQQKLSQDLYEGMKPLARHHGDEDLEEQLKAQIYNDDPMAEYIQKKKRKEISSVLPEYKGPLSPPNRFGIKPGYRWDGVHRSNGFEKKYFEKMNSSKAAQEEAYLWSVQDM